MAPFSRLAVRFARLPHDALAELAAQLCAEGGAAAAQAEAVLAAHQPVPQWAVEGVLLSSDLVPHVLAPLELEDGAAAAACSAWAAGWRATAERRRKLTLVPFEFPAASGTGTHPVLQFAVITGEEERLVVRDRNMARILDRNMATVDELGQAAARALGPFGSVFAADEQSLFVTGRGSLHDDVVRRLSHDGTEMATYEEEDREFAYPTLAPGGLLFCVAYDRWESWGDRERDEIVALDAQCGVFQPRHPVR